MRQAGYRNARGLIYTGCHRQRRPIFWPATSQAVPPDDRPPDSGRRASSGDAGRLPLPFSSVDAQAVVSRPVRAGIGSSRIRYSARRRPVFRRKSAGSTGTFGSGPLPSYMRAAWWPITPALSINLADPPAARRRDRPLRQRSRAGY